MTFAVAIAVASGVLAVYVGAISHRYARAPGLEEQRWFGLVAYAASIYAFGNVGRLLPLPYGALAFLGGVQVTGLFVELWAWLMYVDVQLQRRPSAAERRARAGLFVLAGLCLVPGVLFTGELFSHPVPALGIVYTEPVTSRVGAVIYVLALCVAGLVLVRLVAAWRAGRPGAGGIALAFGAIALFGLNDALVSLGLLPFPFLLDIGFMLPIGAVAWSTTRRFVADAEALHRLRGQLEATVEARTRELARAVEALHQSEKLAALGQFAAGVAHQVNNPAAAVTANLRFLAEDAAAGGAPEEAQASIRESLESMQRINVLVRRLVDAGRLAAAPNAAGTAAVSRVVEQAVDEARARTGDRIDYLVRPLAGAQLALGPEVLREILMALLLNAGEAVPSDRRGRVTVAVERAEQGRLRLTVTDDGAGLTDDVLRRAFEPFFSTKPEGLGSGLGLPVALALAESHGGRLRLERAPEGGTRAVLELPGE